MITRPKKIIWNFEKKDKYSLNTRLNYHIYDNDFDPLRDWKNKHTHYSINKIN